MAVSIANSSIPLDNIKTLQKDLLIADEASVAQHSQAQEQVATAHNHDDILDSQVGETQDGAEDRGHPRLPIMSEAAPIHNPDMAEPTAMNLAQYLSKYDDFPGGDTQPMDTQVYHDFRKQNQHETPARPITVIESTTGGKSLENATNLGIFGAQDENSHIDLINSWPEVMSPGAKTAMSETDELLASPETQAKDNARRVAFPKTPQLAGHKRTSNGEMLQSIARSEQTPGNIFGPLKTPMVSATQLFQQTQAVSSPLPEGLRSDAVLIRPSPNFQDNHGLTSHTGYSSSPVLVRHNGVSSTADEPRDRYVSMRESQDRRSRSRSGLPDVQEEDEDDSMLDDFEAQQHQSRVQRVLSDQALAECRVINAPGRVNSSGTVVRQRQPANRHPDGVMSSPPQAKDSGIAGQTSREAIVVEEDPLSDSDEDEAVDEYDEFNQTVRQSQVEGVRNLETPANHKHHLIGDPAEDDHDVIPGSLPSQNTAQMVYHPPHTTSISGSQIIPQSEKRSLLQATAQLHPSSDRGVVPGSQYELAQRHDRSKTIDQTVPSSPPLPALELETAEDDDDKADRDHVPAERPSQIAKESTFATANTHRSPSRQRSLAVPSASQMSMASPLKAAGALRFAEISGRPGLRRDESMDIDGLVSGILTEEDQQYLETVSSPVVAPARKRRRVERTVLSSDLNADKQNRVADDDAEADSAALPSVVEQEAEGTLDTPDTPPSIRRREAAGSAAVSQMIAGRPQPGSSPAKLSGLGKRTYTRRGQAKALAPIHNAVSGRAESVGDDTNSTPNAKPVQRIEASRMSALVVPGNDAVQTSDAPTPFVSRRNELAAADEVQTCIRPDRVFALFKDGNNKYYPGTFSSKESTVRFDDGTRCPVKPDEIAPLDLRIGDLVKIDIPHMRTDWIISAFEHDPGANLNDAKVDIYGHSSLRVMPKHTKQQNIPVAKNDDGSYSINISSIYLSRASLTTYRDREIPRAHMDPTERPSTPKQTEFVTAISTPQTRSARKAARRTFYGSSPPSASAHSVLPSPVSLNSNGLFSEMAFAITLQDSSEALKERLVRSIVDEGGMVLDNGFDELFAKVDTFIGDAKQHKIKPKYESLRLVALIADRPTRKAKYMQALALGLPTLHTRYILDNTDRHKRSGTSQPHDWRQYMLSAGQSAYLDGAERSRSHNVYEASNLSFKNAIAKRDLLFKNTNVLVVLPPEGLKSDAWRKRLPYVSLLSALGVEMLTTTPDLEEAAIRLASGTWQFVYVDSDVSLALSSIMEGKVVSKKRKRSEGGTKQHGDLFAKSEDNAFTVISDEFIVQCLIFGGLIN